MPRVTFSPAEQHEQRWAALASWLADALVQLRPGRSWQLRARPGTGSWVVRLERQGAVLEASVFTRFKRSLSPEQEAGILDLGWAPRRHEYVVHWDSGAVAVRPVGVFEALVRGRAPERDWLAVDDRRDVAGLLIDTITGPLGVIDADDIAWDVR